MPIVFNRHTDFKSAGESPLEGGTRSYELPGDVAAGDTFPATQCIYCRVEGTLKGWLADDAPAGAATDWGTVTAGTILPFPFVRISADTTAQFVLIYAR